MQISLLNSTGAARHPQIIFPFFLFCFIQFLLQNSTGVTIATMQRCGSGVLLQEATLDLVGQQLQEKSLRETTV